MNDELSKLESLIEALLERQKKSKKELEESRKEVERLKIENSELRAMLQSQSARVDALLKKLEKSLMSTQKIEGSVQNEKNCDVRVGESEVQIYNN